MTETLQRPLMGVRIFSVDDEGYIGSLTGRGGRWEPDMPQRAKCEKNEAGRYSMRYAYYNSSTGKYHTPPEPEPHDPPDDTCGCGYYAFYGVDGGKMTYAMQNPGFREYGSDHVRAVVSAWGDVVLHETGFRSEWMQIEAFIVDTSGYRHFGHYIDLIPAWESLANRYAVPLLDEEDVDSFCRERGEVMESRDLQAERWQQVITDTRASYERLSREMVKIAERAQNGWLRQRSRENKRPLDASKPTNFQEAIEKKRNQPAFWRGAAGGDVWHG